VHCRATWFISGSATAAWLLSSSMVGLVLVGIGLLSLLVRNKGVLVLVLSLELALLGSSMVIVEGAVLQTALVDAYWVTLLTICIARIETALRLAIIVLLDRDRN